MSVVCLERFCCLVSIFGGIILGCDDETTSFFGSSIYTFDDIDELLLGVEKPVDLVVVTGAEINLRRHEQQRSI